MSSHHIGNPLLSPALLIAEERHGVRVLVLKTIRRDEFTLDDVLVTALRDWLTAWLGDDEATKARRIELQCTRAAARLVVEHGDARLYTHAMGEWRVEARFPEHNAWAWITGWLDEKEARKVYRDEADLIVCEVCGKEVDREASFPIEDDSLARVCGDHVEPREVTP